MYAFVNAMDDAVLPGKYDKKTTRVFEQIVQACIAEEEGVIRNSDDFHFVRHNVALDITRQEIIKIVRCLCVDKWLVQNDCVYGIGPRTYVECDRFLEECGARRSRDGAIIIRDKKNFNFA